MTQRAFLAAFLGAILLTGVAVSVSAQLRGPGPMGPGPMGPMGGPGRMGGPGFMLPGLQQLDLTDEQKTQIKTLTDSHRDEQRPLTERLMAAQQALHEAAESGDEATIRAKASDLAAAIADEAILRAKVHAEIRGVLTDEQRQKLDELRSQMQERMKVRRFDGSKVRHF